MGSEHEEYDFNKIEKNALATFYNLLKKLISQNVRIS